MISILSGERTDDIVSSVLLYKFFRTVGVSTEIPYYFSDIYTAATSAYTRCRTYIKSPSVFIGLPLDPITYTTWQKLWDKYAPVADIKTLSGQAARLYLSRMPFFLDNHISSFNSFSKEDGAIVTEGESISVLVYDYVSQIVDFSAYKPLIELLYNSPNLRTYGEDTQKINVLPYVFGSSYIFTQTNKDPRWIEDALISETVKEFMMEQRKRIELLKSQVTAREIQNLKFAFYTGKSLNTEDIDNFYGGLLKFGLKEEEAFDVVVAFRMSSTLSKGFIIDVRTKMAEVRSILEVIKALLPNGYCDITVNTKNRGTAYINRRSRENKGSFISFTKNYLIPALETNLKQQMIFGKTCSQLSFIGY